MRFAPAQSESCSAPRRCATSISSTTCCGRFASAIIVSVDAREATCRRRGWQETTTHRRSVIGRLQQRGVRSFVYTNVDQDGMLEGPDLDEVTAHCRRRARARSCIRAASARSRTSSAWRRCAQVKPRRRDRRQGALRGHASRSRGARRPRRQRLHLKPRHPLPRRRRRPRRQGHRTSSTCATPATPSSSPRATTPRRRRARVPRHHCDARARDTIIDVVARAPPSEVFIPFTIGGGIRTRRRRAAAAAMPAPTRSRSTPPPSSGRELIAELADEFGAQCVVVAIDARRAARRPAAGRCSSHGGRTPTGTTPSPGPRGASGRRRRDPADRMDRDGTRTATTSS